MRPWDILLCGLETYYYAALRHTTLGGRARTRAPFRKIFDFIWKHRKRIHDLWHKDHWMLHWYPEKKYKKKDLKCELSRDSQFKNRGLDLPFFFLENQAKALMPLTSSLMTCAHSLPSHSSSSSASSLSTSLFFFLEPQTHAKRETESKKERKREKKREGEGERERLCIWER